MAQRLLPKRSMKSMKPRKPAPTASARSIDWLDSTGRSLRASFPETADCSEYVAERLAALLLERLPPELCAEMIALLPATYPRRPLLEAYAGSEVDDSIAFPDFIEGARHALGLSELLDSPEYADSEARYENLSRRVAEAFLWLVTIDLPPDLKARMAALLPMDLRSRMNLYTGIADESKVA